MSKAIILFHQGFTDILNSISLVNYYKEKYKELILIIRNNETIKHICNQCIKENVKIIYKEFREIGDYLEKKDNLKKIEDEYKDYDYLYIGGFDKYRKDKYKNKFNINKKISFLEKFYICYDIEFENRINYFYLNRNIERENELYSSLIKNNEDYIITHDSYNNIRNINKNIKKIELHNLVINILDTIKLIENAKEIHVNPSIYSILIYLCNKKYKAGL
jgi:hypothetical protein